MSDEAYTKEGHLKPFRYSPEENEKRDDATMGEIITIIDGAFCQAINETSEEEDRLRNVLMRLKTQVLNQIEKVGK